MADYDYLDHNYNYFMQKDIEDFRKHSHYMVGERITYTILGQSTGTIIKVTHAHFSPSDGKEIPFHYTVKSDMGAPRTAFDIVFPKDIQDGPYISSSPMNVYVGGDRIVGSVDKTGIVSDGTHRIIGSVDNRGNISDHTNRIVGLVNYLGFVRDNSPISDHTNRIVGSVDYLGFVRDGTNRIVGSVTGIHEGIKEDPYFQRARFSIHLAGGAGLLLLLKH